jgi:hypothetical protein
LQHVTHDGSSRVHIHSPHPLSPCAWSHDASGSPSPSIWETERVRTISSRSCPHLFEVAVFDSRLPLHVVTRRRGRPCFTTTSFHHCSIVHAIVVDDRAIAYCSSRVDRTDRHSGSCAIAIVCDSGSRSRAALAPVLCKLVRSHLLLVLLSAPRSSLKHRAMPMRHAQGERAA